MGEDLKVRIYPRDVLGRYLYIDGVFERDCWNFVKGFLRPGMVVFDLGANLGQYTLLAAHAVGEHGHVHSFEPSARMFRELEFNVGLNGLSPRCTLNRLAVSDVAQVARLSRYEEGAEVYGSLGTHRRCEAGIVGHEEVQTVRLEEYCEKNRIDRIDFVKMDIEGAELLALRGAGRLLARDDAPTILLELGDVNTAGFGYTSADLWDYLEGLGYHLYSLGPRGASLRQAQRPGNSRWAINLVAAKEGRVRV
ncbi:MAG: FkbM family methyltransferase [Candidatus Coatesbacteria bacterium]|nr:FkbM family methyltransferase [Candidatus Coatesbacteria bacterium]